MVSLDIVKGCFQPGGKGRNMLSGSLGEGKESLHHDIQRETSPCMVFSFLITVSTAGFGPRPLTNSAGAHLRDLVIQFLTVGSRNLPRASLTSWTHWEKIASFLGGGSTPLNVEILRAAPCWLTASLRISSIILMNLASPLGSSGWGAGCQASSSSSLLFASATSSWVATLHSVVIF